MFKPNLTLTLVLSFISILAFVAQTNGQIVINEIYPSGGNSGATYNADFIEFYNSGGTSVNLTGYTLWYATASGNFNTSISLTGTIPAMGYFLVQTRNPGTNGVPLPTPDQTATSPNMATTGGNVLLSDPTFVLASGFACPPNGTTGVVDRVGYGTGNCPEVAAAPAPGTNTNSVTRTPTGTDNDNNSDDFMSVVATPQASGTTAAEGTIAGRVVNPKRRGLRFVTLKLSGGALSAPLYTTSDMFGKYEFQDIPVGDAYLLEIISDRYNFEQTSMVINFVDNFTDANFVGSYK